MLEAKFWKIFKITLALAVLIAWGVAIFRLSGMSSVDSNDASVSIVDSAIQRILVVTNNHHITNVHLTDEQIDYAAALINAPLRKVFHAGVYFVLVLLAIIVGCTIFSARRYWSICLISLLICILFAITDEFHQTFISGRTGQFLDVLIDSIGAFLGVTFASSYYFAYSLGRRSHTSTDDQDPPSSHA